jgi:hypothetical protein
MELTSNYNKYILGIDIVPLNEDTYIDPNIFQLIKEEQLLYETFLSTIKDFAKDKLNKTVDVIKDWKDAAVVFAKILSSGELLNDFLDPLRRRVQKIINEITNILKRLKLDSLVQRIKNFFKKILNLKGWKSLFSLLSLGGILFYITKKLPKDGIKAFINQYLSENFLEDVLSKLTNWKTFTGWLSPIIGGIGILYEFIKDLLREFSQALKSSSSWATKLIKENNKKMKNDILKQLIKEEIRKTLKEEEEKASGVDSKINLTPLIKQLPDVDPIKFNTVFNLLKQKATLNTAANKILADTFISLMKNADVALLNKFMQAFKRIK